MNAQTDWIDWISPDYVYDDRESSCSAATFVRLVAGYMLLYDDQGVSLVYGTLSGVDAIRHCENPYLPSFLLNDEQKDEQNDKKV